MPTTPSSRRLMSIETASSTVRTFLHFALVCITILSALIPLLHLSASRAAEIGGALTVAATVATFLWNLIQDLGGLPSLSRRSDQAIADIAQAVEQAIRDTPGIPVQLAIPAEQIAEAIVEALRKLGAQLTVVPVGTTTMAQTD